MSLGRILALIPARGGSKGLPRKNARSLGGEPLIKWTVEAISAAKLHADVTVCVSTDNEEIAEIGRRCGAEVPFSRPSHLATDSASAVDVALHALEWYEQQRSACHTVVMLLQPTSPFRRPIDLTRAVALLSPDVAAVIGVKEIHRSTSTLFFADENFSLAPLEESAKPISRRQETKPILTPNGALYVVRADTLKSSRSFFPQPLKGVVMDLIASIDIDDPIDWSIAEAVVGAGLVACCSRKSGMAASG